MNAALVGSRRPWVTSQDSMPPALEIVLLKRTVVLSWNQFVYAEGGNDKVRIAFASHDAIVRGAGLGPLVADVSAQCVLSIHEPARADRFSGEPARFIRDVEVRRVDAP